MVYSIQMVWQNALGVPAVIMLNHVTGFLGLKIETLFQLVHNTKPDSKTWFELFFIGYFNHNIDNRESRYKLQSHTLNKIAVYWKEK